MLILLISIVKRGMNMMKKVPYNTNKVKQINIDLVKEIVRNNDHVTKSYIAEQTGLSVATCGNILRELVQTGEVIESELGQPSGGRPPRTYSYNAHFALVACIYISNENNDKKMRLAIVNLVGEVLKEETFQFKRIDYSVIELLISDVIAEFPLIKAVGIGIPGVVLQGVIGVCEIEEMVDVRLEQLLQEKYDIDIIIENDMNCSAFGIYKLSKEPLHSIVVMCFLRHNYPGSGMIMNGQIVRGFSNFAGEISFLPYSLTREEQFGHLHQEETFIPLAVKAITSMIAIFNPEQIVLTGGLCDVQQISMIMKECQKIIPHEHMPTLKVQEDIHNVYMKGLQLLTLEKLTYQLQLVEKIR